MTSETTIEEIESILLINLCIHPISHPLYIRTYKHLSTHEYICNMQQIDRWVNTRIQTKQEWSTQAVLTHLPSGGPTVPSILSVSAAPSGCHSSLPKRLLPRLPPLHCRPSLCPSRSGYHLSPLLLAVPALLAFGGALETAQRPGPLLKTHI